MQILDISHLDFPQAEKQFFDLVDNLENIEMTISFWAEYSQSKIVRDIVREIFTKNAIYPLYGWKFALVADELLNNAIEHGSQPWDVNMCVIRSIKDSESHEFRVSFDVHDTGTGEKMTPEWMRRLRDNIYLNMAGVYLKRRGRGLFLMVEKLVDHLTFDRSPRGWLLVHVDKKIDLQEKGE